MIYLVPSNFGQPTGPAVGPMRMRSILFTLLLAIAATQVQATHIIGGVLYYDHLGNDQYEIFLELYRDCGPGNSNNTQYDALAPIGVFAGGVTTQYLLESVSFPGASSIQVVLDDPCLTAPPTVCVEVAVYRVILTLPPTPEGYVITYQRCCRSPTIINIPTAQDLGITCTVQVPGTPNAENSSARFNEYPPIALCLGQEFSFDHSATDADGDSLVYSLCTPYNGGSPADASPNPVAPPYAEVPWAAGYTAVYPMDSDPAIAIDAQTGLITAVPTLAASYTFGVCVKEYRNGTLISETRRDFRFDVVPCQTTVTAVIEPQSQFCVGLTMPFSNASPNGQYWHWDFGEQGTMADTSSMESPAWTYSGPGTYTVTLVANPGYPCVDTTEAIVQVYLDPIPFFVEPTGCGDLTTQLVAEGGGPNSSYLWQLGNDAMPSTSSSEVVDVQYATTGVHPVSLSITENGCTGTFIGQATMYADPTAFFTVFPPSPQNYGTTILFTDGSTGNGGVLSEWSWSANGGVFGTEQDQSWDLALPGIYQVTLTVTTAEGCSASYSLPYEILEVPIDIPNVFSPNGDGSNEHFDIANIAQHKNQLKIFNRWGMPVFEADNYRNQWAALGVPDGTYFYELLLNDGRAFTGHLTLLR